MNASTGLTKRSLSHCSVDFVGDLVDLVKSVCLVDLVLDLVGDLETRLSLHFQIAREFLPAVVSRPTAMHTVHSAHFQGVRNLRQSARIAAASA